MFVLESWSYQYVYTYTTSRLYSQKGKTEHTISYAYVSRPFLALSGKKISCQRLMYLSPYLSIYIHIRRTSIYGISFAFGVRTVSVPNLLREKKVNRCIQRVFQKHFYVSLQVSTQVLASPSFQLLFQQCVRLVRSLRVPYLIRGSNADYRQFQSPLRRAVYGYVMAIQCPII